MCSKFVNLSRLNSYIIGGGGFYMNNLFQAHVFLLSIFRSTSNHLPSKRDIQLVVML